jgi:hypothetical protein
MSLEESRPSSGCGLLREEGFVQVCDVWENAEDLVRNQHNM